MTNRERIDSAMMKAYNNERADFVRSMNNIMTCLYNFLLKQFRITAYVFMLRMGMKFWISKKIICHFSIKDYLSILSKSLNKSQDMKNTKLIIH